MPARSCSTLISRSSSPAMQTQQCIRLRSGPFPPLLVDLEGARSLVENFPKPAISGPTSAPGCASALFAASCRNNVSFVFLWPPQIVAHGVRIVVASSYFAPGRLELCRVMASSTSALDPARREARIHIPPYRNRLHGLTVPVEAMAVLRRCAVARGIVCEMDFQT